jgi:hypothetical protein
MSSEEESSESETSKLRKIWDCIKGKCKKWGLVLASFIDKYGFLMLVPLPFYIILYSENYTLNENSYKIIATFCSIIIGFGINSYFNLVKLEIKSFEFITTRFRIDMEKKKNPIWEKATDNLKKEFNENLEQSDIFDKILIDIKNILLSELKFFLLSAFVLLYLSILAVSSIDSFSKIGEIAIISLICELNLVIYVIFKRLSYFYSKNKHYRDLHKKLNDLFTLATEY